MGIDAEVFVRHRGKPLTKDQVLELSVKLCAAFGPKEFLIVKDSTWGNPHHALSIVKKWEQDGPTITPEKGEQFIRCHLWTRFYGENYERGDLVLILAVADWLQAHFPKGQVWYGGDSSGVTAEHLDGKYRKRLWGHFCQLGHEPYSRYFDRDNKHIMFCSFCKVQMIRNGWGGNDTYMAWYCPGCGDSFESRDGGKTLTTKLDNPLSQDPGKIIPPAKPEPPSTEEEVKPRRERN